MLKNYIIKIDKKNRKNILINKKGYYVIIWMSL